MTSTVMTTTSSAAYMRATISLVSYLRCSLSVFVESVSPFVISDFKFLTLSKWFIANNQMCVLCTSIYTFCCSSRRQLLLSSIFTKKTSIIENFCFVLFFLTSILDWTFWNHYKVVQHLKHSVYEVLLEEDKYCAKGKMICLSTFLHISIAQLCRALQ